MLFFLNSFSFDALRLVIYMTLNVDLLVKQVVTQIMPQKAFWEFVQDPLHF